MRIYPGTLLQAKAMNDGFPFWKLEADSQPWQDRPQIRVRAGGRQLGGSDGYDLVSPTSPAHWATYHDIRRIVLFERRGWIGVYNSQHPDELKSNHFPKLLCLDGTPIGVIRIDVEGETAWFRRVAITEAYQRRGHGRVLLGLAEAFSRERGVVRVLASVAAGAVGFYRCSGYRALTNPDDAGAVRVTKSLACSCGSIEH